MTLVVVQNYRLTASDNLFINELEDDVVVARIIINGMENVTRKIHSSAELIT